jgi:hypothetical protein
VTIRLEPGDPTKWIQEYRRPKGRKGIIYGTRISSSLAGWAPTELETTVTDLGDGWEQVTTRADRPAGDEDSFIQLTVEED